MVSQLSRGLGRITERVPLRSVAVLAIALLAAAGLLVFLGERTPFRNWLALPLGTILFWQLVLNLAWVSVGFAITTRLLPDHIPRLERLVISVAAGVTAFFLGLYLLGALGLFRKGAVVAMAALFILCGAQDFVLWWRASKRPDTPEPGIPPLRGLSLAAAIVGIIGVGIIYLGAFSPAAVNFDATWLHLTLPEVWAREGRVVPFSGDWVRELPLLASVIHVWDFLVPSLPHPAAHWMAALHTEFSLFLWTLVGIAAAVNWLIGTKPVRGAWAAFMLFPGIFVYDGNLGGASDHVAAFFLIPVLLLTVRARSFATVRSFALWGAIAGAATMTKYQTLYALAPLGVLVLFAIFRRGRELRSVSSQVRAMAWLVALFVVVIAPPLLKNWVFHRNPFYPLLLDWFPGTHPNVNAGALLVDYNWTAPTQLGPRVREALELIFTFAFNPHYSFVGNIPIYGFAFTLSLPILLVIPKPQRLWVGAAVCLGALFFWGFTYRVDRNLQIFLPLLVASTAATLIRAWRIGWLARSGVAVLVAVQFVWASDLYFTSQNQMTDAIALINSGRLGRAQSRFDTYFPDHFALDRFLPKDAVLLVHQNDPQLGFPRRSYLDQVGWQGVIDYRTFKTPRDLYDRLKALGVTHVVHVPGGQRTPYLQEEAIFNSFVAGAPGPKTRIGAFEVVPMPPSPPPQRAPLRVLTLGMGQYADGLYPVTALDFCFELPAATQHYNEPSIRVGPRTAASLLTESDVALVGANGADPATTEILVRDFQVANSYGGLTVHVRRSSLP